MTNFRVKLGPPTFDQPLVLIPYADFASSQTSGAFAEQSTYSAFQYLGSGDVVGYLAPDPGTSTPGRLRFQNNYVVNTVTLDPTCTIVRDPLTYGGTATFAGLTQKRFRVWLRTVEGVLRAGLREDEGTDGWGVAVAPDDATLWVNTSNRLTTDSSGSEPAGGTPTDPSTATTSSQQVSVRRASTRSGIVLTADGETSIRTTSGINPQVHGAIAVNPDWTTVAISDGADTYRDAVRVAFGSLEGKIIVLEPPALTRGLIFRFGFLLGGTSRTVPEGSEYDLPFVWRNDPDLDPLLHSYYEWTPLSTSPDPTAHETAAVRVPYDGQYIVSGQWGVTWFSGASVFGNNATATLRLKQNGTTVLTDVLVALGPISLAANDGSADTSADAHQQYSASLPFSEGDLLTATVEWAADFPSSGRSLTMLDDDNWNHMLLQGIG